MNPIVRLILAVALGLAWLLVNRAYAPESRISKVDPAGNGRRRDITLALRAMAFFGLVWFIVSTVVIFAVSLVVALVAPPANRDFVDAFSDVLNSATGTSGPLQPLSLGGALMTFAATIITVWYSQRTARSQPLSALGLKPYKGLTLDVVMGLVLGPLLFAVVYQIETALDYLKVSPGPFYNWGSLAVSALIFLALAFSEELVVRGYFLQTIDGVWGGLPATVLTSVFWGFAHLFNPHADLLAVFNIIVAGLIFAYAYSITGHLWLPIALHFSWNFAEGALFGYPVSGYPVENPIFQATPDGPTQLTGGRFGPEGGLISLLALLLVGLILFGWERTRRPTGDKS